MTLPALVWLLLATIWGSTWLFIKIGLADLPPITFAGIRFVVASAPLGLWIAVRRVPLPRAPRDRWLMAWTGLLTFTVNYALVFWGETHRGPQRAQFRELLQQDGIEQVAHTGLREAHLPDGPGPEAGGRERGCHRGEPAVLQSHHPRRQPLERTLHP